MKKQKAFIIRFTDYKILDVVMKGETLDEAILNQERSNIHQELVKMALRGANCITDYISILRCMFGTEIYSIEEYDTSKMIYQQTRE